MDLDKLRKEHLNQRKSRQANQSMPSNSTPYKNILNNEELNIPAFNDELINREIKQQEIIEEQKINAETYKEEKILEEEEKKEYKKTLIPFMNINGYLLIGCVLCIALGITSIVNLKIIPTIYAVISIIFTLFIGRRLRFKEPDCPLLNLLLWNLSQSINDFFKHKIEYEVISNLDKAISITGYTLLASVMVLNSNCLFYGISLLGFIVVFIMCMAVREFNEFNIFTKKIMVGCLFGLVFKTIFETFIFGAFTVDFFNIVVLNLMAILNLFAEKITITEPEE